MRYQNKGERERERERIGLQATASDGDDRIKAVWSAVWCVQLILGNASVGEGPSRVSVLERLICSWYGSSCSPGGPDRCVFLGVFYT
jgi:hypothetical protein